MKYSRTYDIKYPIFLEIIAYVDDTFWSHIFQELAYGNTPYGTYIDQESMVLHSIGRGKLAYFCFAAFCEKLQNSETSTTEHPSKLYNGLYHFLHDVLGIQSMSEHVAQNSVLVSAYTMRSMPWIEIKKKHIRELLIQNYVIEIRHKYNLSNAQMKSLLSNILLWFQFKLLTKNDVEYDSENCRITRIRELFINKNGQIRLNRELKSILAN